MKSNNLTDRQAAFVAEYLLDLNATQAAIRAGYSEKTAEQYGHQLLKKTLVKAAVDAALGERAKRSKRSADDVLRDLATIRADAMQMVADRDGNMVMADRAAAIKTLELEGKHLAMFTDKQLTDLTTGGQPLSLTVEFVKASREG